MRSQRGHNSLRLLSLRLLLGENLSESWLGGCRVVRWWVVVSHVPLLLGGIELNGRDRWIRLIGGRRHSMRRIFANQRGEQRLLLFVIVDICSLGIVSRSIRFHSIDHHSHRIVHRFAIVGIRPSSLLLNVILGLRLSWWWWWRRTRQCRCWFT